MRNISPHKVVGGFNRREPQAISWLYATYYPVVFNLVFQLTGRDCPDIEDLVAESFLKLLKSSARFDRLSRIRSFLLYIAKNLCLDYLKRNQFIRERLSGWESDSAKMSPENMPDEEVDTDELYLNHVYEAMQKLTPKDRQLFTLSFIRRLSNEEVAEKLNVSSKTIKNMKVLVMKKLKAILRKIGLLIILNIFL